MKKLLLPALMLFLVFNIHAQYISRSQPVPFNCPTVCPGSIIVLEVPQVQNLNNGDTVQVWLSNASGSFASGTTTLNSTAYSLNTGTTWTPGPYLFSGNVNNLYLQITIPNNLPAGTGYTIYMKTSAGFVAVDLFQCSGGNTITVIPAYATLPVLPANTQGLGFWDASVFTWVPTTGAMLNTTALVSAQDFFDPANYKGYFIKDSLGFDINFTAFGGDCPGSPGVLNDGTSIPCSQGYQTDFSIRMKRKQNFAPGLYTLTIQGDDGIRLSIDGGNTWILSSFFEQTYPNSFQTTTTNYPNGVCLSGPTDLVIEYFQRPADARLTFTCTAIAAVTLPPASQTVCAGNNASFNITAPNTATFQWLYSTNNGATFVPVPNAAPFSGANTNDLTIAATPAGYNGYLFACAIGGLCGALDTTAADTLLVGGGAITSQPANVSVCAGLPASFTVGASGSSYQWQVNTGGGFVNLTNAPPYAGATSATLNISSATAGMNGYQYQCIVNGCGGSPLTSNAATLSIGAAAGITSQPSDASVCAGGNTGFSIVAQNASSYQWQVNSGSGFVNVSNGAPYTGATGTALSISPVTAGMTGYQYQCIVTGCGGGTVTSSAATLTIGAGASIVTQPQSASVCPGGNAIFSISAQNASSYQWQVNTGSGFADVTNASPYSGGTTANLSVSPVSAGMSGYQYQCIISGCGGADITSNAATLSLGASASITTQPHDSGICVGTDAGFGIVAQNAASYQWQVNTGSGFVNVTNTGSYTGSTGATLTIVAPTTAMSGYQYQCVVTGCAGATVTSTVVTLTVNNGATFVNQPADVTICEGENAGFSITTTAVTTYQWQVNTGSGFVNITDGVVYANSNTDVLQLNNPATSMNGYQYRCVILGCGGGNINSNVAILHINGFPVILAQPADANVCQVGNVSFTVSASGTNNTFQWQVSNDGGNTYTDLSNAAPYQNVQTQTLSVTGAGKPMINNYYRCVVTACGQSVNSAAANVTVCPDAVNLFIPNTFTPNGDGINDYFEIYYNTNDLLYIDLKIFNRWGEKIFETTDLHFKWDGTYKSVLQGAGVYTYSVTLLFPDKQDAVHKKGTIMLLR